MEDDYELLYLAREDMESVIDCLYKKYKAILCYKARKYSPSKLDFEDYLNEAKLTLCEAVENYHDTNTFITYLNKCLNSSLSNYHKSSNRNKYKILNDAISMEDDAVGNISYVNDEKQNPERILLEESEYEELKDKILKKLSWKEELIFTLKEQNYTAKEISEITDNNLRTVYNIVSRIRNKISKLMSN